MNPISQMMPGMQFIPLIAFLIRILVVALMTWLGWRLLRTAFRDRIFGAGTIGLLAVASLIVIRFSFLQTPVSESRVLNAAKPGITVTELISVVGEPHEKRMNADGSGTLHYYADYIGHTGIGVIIKSDGTIDSAWVE